MGMGCNMLAELQALRVGLTLSYQFNISNLIVETNLLLLIGLIMIIFPLALLTHLGLYFAFQNFLSF